LNSAKVLEKEGGAPERREGKTLDSSSCRAKKKAKSSEAQTEAPQNRGKGKKRGDPSQYTVGGGRGTGEKQVE